MVSDAEVDQYLETALWSSTDWSDEQGGEPLDANFTIYDFSDKARDLARAELESFWSEAQRVVDVLVDDDLEPPDLRSWPYDFWLTRNGHGVGFWDKEDRYGAAAEPFTELAKRFGERSVFILDDDRGLEFD